MQVSTLAWSDYIGRIGCGRVLAGGLKVGDELQRVTTRHLEIGDPDAGWEFTGAQAARVTHLWVTRGLENREVDEVAAGDIVWLAGPDDITLGDTLASPELRGRRRGAAAARDRGADGQHVLPRQQRPVRRPGRPRRDPASDQGPAGARAARQRRAPRRGPRPPRRRQGERPRRAAPRHPHRGDAPRGPRALRQPPRGHHPPRLEGQAPRAHGAAHHRRARGVPGRDHPGAQPAQGRAGRGRVDRAPASSASSSRSRRAA